MKSHSLLALLSVGVGAIFTVAPMSARADEAFFVSNTNNTIEQFTPTGVGSQFTNSGLHSPEGLAIDSAGNVYAANSANTAIEKYTPAGGTGTVFSSFGTSNKAGLAFDSMGDLFAAGFGNNTIEEYSPAGTPSVFASDPGDHSVVYQPQGIAFDSLGNLYVANLNFIEKFTPAGSPSRFATPGHALGGLAIDSDNNVFVSYFNDNKIEEFNSLGNDEGAFADPNDSSILAIPLGLAFDSDGNLYAANITNFIEEFAPDGTPSRFATDPGDGTVMHDPQYIAIGVVPEPSSLALLCVGTGILLVATRRRNHQISPDGHLAPWCV